MDKVTFKDWLLAFVGLIFTLSGLLVIRSDFKVGVTTLVFFGACLAVAVRIILRKRRLRRQSTLTATVVGGEPIRPSRGRAVALGLGLLVVGVTLAVFQPKEDRIFLGCALLTALAGGVVLVAAATGRLSKSYFQFEPEGIVFGYAKGKATVPWSAITKVARGEIHSNPAVFLWVLHDAVSAEPASYLGKVRKQMASCSSWMGADFVIMSSMYGIDAPVLVAALDRYVTLPEARLELQAPHKLSR